MRKASPRKDDERRREADMARAIRGYLAECPQAMDTLEGIAEWWLMRQHVRVEATALARVVRQLIDTGYLEEVGDGESRRYRLKGLPHAGDR